MKDFSARKVFKTIESPHLVHSHNLKELPAIQLEELIAKVSMANMEFWIIAFCMNRTVELRTQNCHSLCLLDPERMAMSPK